MLLSNLPALLSLGLGELRTINGRFVLSHNALLPNANDLSNLRTVSGGFILQNNSMLAHLDTFTRLATVGFFHIPGFGDTLENPMLSRVCEAVCEPRALITTSPASGPQPWMHDFCSTPNGTHVDWSGIDGYQAFVNVTNRPCGRNSGTGPSCLRCAVSLCERQPPFNLPPNAVADCVRGQWVVTLPPGFVFNETFTLEGTVVVQGNLSLAPSARIEVLNVGSLDNGTAVITATGDINLNGTILVQPQPGELGETITLFSGGGNVTGDITIEVDDSLLNLSSCEDAEAVESRTENTLSVVIVIDDSRCGGDDGLGTGAIIGIAAGGAVCLCCCLVCIVVIVLAVGGAIAKASRGQKFRRMMSSSQGLSSRGSSSRISTSDPSNDSF